MKKSISILAFILFVFNTSYSQNEVCDCKKELDFMVEKIQKMPSYKKQIKGEKLKAFETTFTELSSKMNEPISIETCFKYLQKQLLLINDVHSNIAVSKKYNGLQNYTSNLLPQINPENLKDSLSKKSLTDIEGLYSYKDELIIGVMYHNSKSKLTGIVLESKLPQWKMGDIKFEATPIQDSKYHLYDYHIEQKTPSLLKSLTLENGRIWGYKKIGNTANEELPIKGQTNWEFKQLNDTTQYLYFGHFSNRNKKEHQAFYESVKDKLTAQNIIVDLRNNAGGNKKFSDVYLKLLKNKIVYILTNCFTGSNGEQFTHKLRKLKNATHLGQTTRGVISYGMNYGYSYNSPSGYFEITPTDMDFHEYFEFESKGISPEIQLDFDKDWIQQTLEIIQKRS
ncbi:hypothetical protein IU405_08800 [Polaribacter sp. BAL334]|uniref:S41 family peptidase n=1 Tax=Polaribacter sp. BAL334 TaxID=1708178 RepID=UPI0018D21542|nr:S41 family peptidase [Polaribacter sp. BAL334]MBG7612344.1 hypothetical protein [Polaribacter sp. BAL334]